MNPISVDKYDSERVTETKRRVIDRIQTSLHRRPKPGDIHRTAVSRTQYKVAQDGSWRKQN